MRNPLRLLHFRLKHPVPTQTHLLIVIVIVIRHLILLHLLFEPLLHPIPEKKRYKNPHSDGNPNRTPNCYTNRAIRHFSLVNLTQSGLFISFCTFPRSRDLLYLSILNRQSLFLISMNQAILQNTFHAQSSLLNPSYTIPFSNLNSHLLLFQVDLKGSAIFFFIYFVFSSLIRHTPAKKKRPEVPFSANLATNSAARTLN